MTNWEMLSGKGRYMNKTIKIGILGGGFISGIHYECMRKVFGINVDIIGIYDVIEEKCREFAQNRNIKAFDNIEKMLDEVDAVDICTPPFAHYENILRIAQAGKHIMCEKPLIGYAPSEKEAEFFAGIHAPKQKMLSTIRNELKKTQKTILESGIKFIYLENFVYTPQVQKEAEILRKTKSQILRMTGEESHKGNHAAYSSWWKYSCGGSLISTGSHPLGALLYLKRVEGECNLGRPIRPKGVSARIHQLTKIESFRDCGFIRSDYHDVEDYGFAHIVFEDGTVGDVFAGATVLGGINDYIEVFANNHRTRCNINPVDLVKTYNPKGEQFADVYTNYGISTNEGWLFAAPDENWMFGYQAEMQDAIECFCSDKRPESCLELAIDTSNVIYSAYLSAEKMGKEVII